MKSSFPYMQFAKRHGLDYGTVLRAADCMEAVDRGDAAPVGVASEVLHRMTSRQRDLLFDEVMIPERARRQAVRS